jgi:hypothetical protein
MSGECQREMSLREWVERLPEIHHARKEYAALIAKVENSSPHNSPIVPCPTCGAACRVYSGDEGTSSYEPVTSYREQQANQEICPLCNNTRKVHFPGTVAPIECKWCNR